MPKNNSRKLKIITVTMSDIVELMNVASADEDKQLAEILEYQMCWYGYGKDEVSKMVSELWWKYQTPHTVDEITYNFIE